MPKINPKPEDLIKSQIASFAAEELPEFKDRSEVFNTIGRVARGEHGDEIVKVLQEDEYYKDKSGQYIKYPKGTIRLIAKMDDYINYLRKSGGSSAEGISGRHEILENYSNFAGIVQVLKKEVKSMGKKHQAYLGSGSNSSVFVVEVNNKKYAIRIPKGDSVRPEAIDSHIAGAFLGKGIEHLEQIVAASYEDGVTVSEVMPGVEVGNLKAEDINNISDQQLSELIDTLLNAFNLGIEIDPKPSNFFYDHIQGFGIIDYHSSRGQKSSKDQELGEVVGWMSAVIDNAGFYGTPYKSSKTLKDYASDLDKKRAILDVLMRFKKIVTERLSGAEREKALAQIESRIADTEEMVKNLSDPVWVNNKTLGSEASKNLRPGSIDKHSSPSEIPLDII